MQFKLQSTSQGDAANQRVKNMKSKKNGTGTGGASPTGSDDNVITRELDYSEQNTGKRHSLSNILERAAVPTEPPHTRVVKMGAIDFVENEKAQLGDGNKGDNANAAFGSSLAPPGSGDQESRGRISP